MPLYRSCLLFSVLLAAVLSLFYLPFIMGWQSYYLADLTYYFQPFTEFIVSQYRQGRIPTWNPYLYCGMSQIAVPSPGMFYPPIVFFVLNSFSSGLALYLLFHHVVAGAGAFLLIGAIGWGLPAAIMGGIAVSCCGYMFALKSNYTLVAAIAWLPMLLFSLWKTGPRYTRSNLLWVGVAALMTFMTIAAGRPEISVPCGVCAAVFTIAAAVHLRDFKTFGWRCLAGVAGLLLAMPIILPAIEWVRLSPRSQGLELRWVLMWSANWYDFLCLVFAQPLGDLTELGSKYLNMVASRPNAIPYLTSAFVGPIVFTFAVWGFLDKGWSWRWWIIGALVATSLMALGENTFFAPTVAGSSPALAAFRYPVKLMVLPALCLIVAGARGLHRVTENRLSVVAQIVTATVWVLFLFVGIVFFLSPELATLTMRFPWNQAPNAVNLEAMMEAQVLFARSFISGAIVGILICWTTWLVRMKQLPLPTYCAMVLCGLAGTLLAPPVMYDRTGTAGDFFTRPMPVAEQLRKIIGARGDKFESRILPTYFDPLTLPPDFAERQALPFQQAFYQNARQLMLPNVNVAAKVPYAFGYEAAETGNYKKFFSQSISVSTQNRNREKGKTDSPLARFCKLSSVSHILTQVYYGKPLRPVPAADPNLFTLVDEDRDHNLRIYKCKNILPRAYWAGKVIPAPAWKDFDWRVMEDAPQDMLSETMIEGAEKKSYDAIKEADTNGIEFGAQQFDYVSLRVKTDATRPLVLVDHFYPGWEAKIDGQPTTIRRANLFFRSVEVPPGSHTVEFAYKPMSLLFGFLTAGAVVLGFIVLLVAQKVFTAVVPKEKSDVVKDVTVNPRN
jgi:hypothetical protein